MMKKNIHYADSKIKTILLQPVNNVSKCQKVFKLQNEKSCLLVATILK